MQDVVIRIQLLKPILILFLILMLTTVAWAAMSDYEIAVGDQDFTVTRIADAAGSDLLIWLAPGHGTSERAIRVGEKLARQGIEVWYVNMAENLFLPNSTTTMRNLNGENVNRLIRAAHKKTGKRITLIARSYGALPVLKGARLWQQQEARQPTIQRQQYLTGAILFSPELYATIPALGKAPVYDPIASSNTFPVMIHQAEKRGNRWQLGSLLQNLNSNGAEVFFRLRKGVAGMFYSGDTSDATLQAQDSLPHQIMTDIKLLAAVNTPYRTVVLNKTIDEASSGLDTALKAYSGKMHPRSLELQSVKGGLISRKNYKNRVTIINFWATWCPPCVKEIPSLNRLRNKMRGKPFELISVNYAENKDRVNSFFERVHVSYPVLLDEDGRESAAWNVIVYPSTFVIGPDGNIAYGVNGAIEWDSDEVVSALNRLLNKR